MLFTGSALVCYPLATRFVHPPPPPPYRRLEELRGEQRELRSRAEALEAEAAGIKREEESALERRDRLMTE